MRHLIISTHVFMSLILLSSETLAVRTDRDIVVQQDLLSLSTKIRKMVIEFDVEKLSKHIHPEKGVLLAPQECLIPGENRVLNADDVVKLAPDTTRYEWGIRDASNDPIIETFGKFWGYFSMSADPDTVSFNHRVSHGNWNWNSHELFPESIFVEYHHFGTTDQDYMNWHSLFIVYEFYEPEKKWYVIALAAGHWSI